MSKIVSVQLDDGLFALAKTAAERQQVTLSEWIRECIRERAKNNLERKLIAQMDARVYKLMQQVEAQEAGFSSAKEHIENTNAHIQKIRVGIENIYKKLLEVVWEEEE